MLGRLGSGKSSEEGNTYKAIENGPVKRIDYVFFTEKLSFPLFDVSIYREARDSTVSDEESSNCSGSSAGKYERFSNHNGLYFELNTSKVEQ